MERGNVWVRAQGALGEVTGLAGMASCSSGVSLSSWACCLASPVTQASTLSFECGRRLVVRTLKWPRNSKENMESHKASLRTTKDSTELCVKQPPQPESPCRRVFCGVRANLLEGESSPQNSAWGSFLLCVTQPGPDAAGGEASFQGPAEWSV